ncbi:GntP family permease [Aestuariirhabdus litorea]|uniref:GntP family permease n=1 Tax=Aestuariirhabdus litorea TaxID=2528527 RepID=A0A3P3VR43_9GAMM|nr:GntP family permease [Aestuariirhabdus litorea]RRJ83293.1 GntP family permease [Aestuariirhabdus litorea]RWW93452.1 GntP family permease [Endozoicomonadaceae bacterium GTF-13]
MEYFGLIGSVALLIWLALRGVDIVFAALACSLVVILTNDLPVAKGVTEYFSFGPLGAFTFAGKFFLLFAAGAVFGRVMGESHAASSLAMALTRALGPQRTLLVTVLFCALLTYGGVVVFVVIFAMYPLGLRLIQEANIPKRLFCAAMALGAGTFTLTAIPGTPSIHNVISAVALKTDLFAGATLGLFGGTIMLVLGLWYLERQRKLSIANGEGFEPGPRDLIVDLDSSEYPRWQSACLPLVAVLGTIILPRLLSMTLSPETLQGEGALMDLLRFANSQPIVWPSIALFVGSVLAVILFKAVRNQGMMVMGRGAQDSIMPLINTAAVIGFGGVVTHTSGFEAFVSVILNSDLPPLLSLFGSVSLVSAITGSASGGLQIFMQTMAPAYLEMGIDSEVLHRIATMASGGFDSLPHCGAVVAMLTVTQLTHKQAYKDVGVVTVVIPVIATLSTMALSTVL